ncbi:prepilin-type N-terminal cleavage/methylation domain-containing protein [Pseudomonas sp. PDM14]|uniref:type IV pilus modification PilV family protein n=1 Tax=Pseudomonas sp. PDM14 TaxID=2769288 RepID=UPI001CE0D5BD|nr:type II secretion system protein [Pseudomonas sp. PDM14]
MSRPFVVSHGSPARQQGMTLVELVITIVIVGIAAAAMFSAMAAITGRSADPMLRQQSLALAEAYLEAITTRAYIDLPAAAQNLQAAQDINGTPILPGYQVSVAVNTGASVGGVAATSIRVTVVDPTGQQLLLDGYRTNY